MAKPTSHAASILVIEDDDKWAGVLERALTRWGYAHTRSANAKDALALLGEHRFDLILLDLCLDHPDMTLETDELLDEIARIHAGVPIIAVTAKDVEGTKVFGLHRQGVIEYVSKLAGTLTELEVKIGKALASDAVVENPPKDPTANLARSRLIAYRQYHMAESQGALVDPTDEEAYNWLREHSDGEELPKFSTWSRYLREARSAHGTRKHSPADRQPGGSVVRSDQVY